MCPPCCVDSREKGSIWEQLSLEMGCDKRLWAPSPLHAEPVTNCPESHSVSVSAGALERWTRNTLSASFSVLDKQLQMLNSRLTWVPPDLASTMPPAAKKPSRAVNLGCYLPCWRCQGLGVTPLGQFSPTACPPLPPCIPTGLFCSGCQCPACKMGAERAEPWPAWPLACQVLSNLLS